MPDIHAPSFALRFACTGCGQCCTGGGSHVVEVSRAEQQRIQRHLGISRAWFRRKYLFRYDSETESLRMVAPGVRAGRTSRRSAPRRCIFLDGENRCRIYQVRPLQCRTYPWWPELMNRRAWRLEARRCEGIGQGGVVPLAQVRKQLARQGR
jgi:Fe-S-cluster containining protein